MDGSSGGGGGSSARGSGAIAGLVRAVLAFSRDAPIRGDRAYVLHIDICVAHCRGVAAQWCLLASKRTSALLPVGKRSGPLCLKRWAGGY